MLEIDERDEAESWVAENHFGDPISDGLRFRFVPPVDDGNDSDVAVGRGNLVTIDVGKDERIIISHPQLDCLHRRDRQDRDEEKTLRPAEDRA